MNRKLITVFSNDDPRSSEARSKLELVLARRGHVVTSEYDIDADLIVCIGGDGAFLEAIHKCSFPSCPIVGVNTGHLGFFQDILPQGMDKFFDDFDQGNYAIQELNTVECRVVTSSGFHRTHYALNEIVVRGRQSYAVHMDISIGNRIIERFSGDGIIVATSAGSTAYNYSLGGSIVDPELDLLQVTPIAPINTTAFRTLTSSILLPSDLSLGILPQSPDDRIFVVNDGMETGYSNVKSIEIHTSEKKASLVRTSGYNFWDKVKDKFL